MKNELKITLLNVLNQCIYNKTIEDFKALTELINSINNENIEDLKIRINDTNVYISMFNSDYQLISMSFTDNNILLFCLPDNVIKTYVIENCGYNIQYDDIKALLS